MTPQKVTPLKVTTKAIPKQVTPTPKLQTPKPQTPKISRDKENTVNAQAVSIHAQSILADFDAQVESRIAEMRQRAEEMKHSISRSLTIQLMKIPKNIRTLKMGEFRSQYQCNTTLAMTANLQKVVDELLPPQQAGDRMETPRYGRSFVDCTNLLTVSRRMTRSEYRKLTSVKKMIAGGVPTPASLLGVQRMLQFNDTTPRPISAPVTARSNTSFDLPQSTRTE
eukprot:c8148_g1_i1.p1 GENE.c8148_g1_i1~~c8148_g1_i1.p1  ORF type:complete len:224 (-),score=57.56 c8148_g1_i1:45-716(-)